MNGVLSIALGHVGAVSILFGQTVKETVRRRPEWPVLIDQLHHLGVRSLAIGTVTALFTGMVLALQTYRPRKVVVRRAADAPAATVCVGTTCSLPVATADDLKKLLL